jgi:ankyrin repeat protein
MAIAQLEPDENTLDEDSLPDEEILIDVCAGLITIDQKSNVVRLVHFTAQEYFERNITTAFPDADKQIARSCLKYMSLTHFTFKDFGKPIIEINPIGALYMYAARQWGRHAVAFESELFQEILTFLNKTSQMRFSLDACEGRVRPIGLTIHPMEYKDLDCKLLLTVLCSLPQSAQYMIEQGANVNMKISNNGSLVERAIIQHDTAMVAVLVKAGAKLESDEKRPGCPVGLRGAVQLGYYEIVDILVTAGVNINYADTSTEPPLIIAAKGNQTEICQLLINRGCDLESFREPNGTALCYAVYDGNAELVRLLLKSKANFEVRNSLGEKCLDIAIRNCDGPVIKELMAAGARFSEIDQNSWEVSICAADAPATRDILFADGLSIENGTLSGETCLHRAAFLGLDTIPYLLSLGADINAKTFDGHTPLDKAILHGMDEYVGWFQEQRALDGSVPTSSILQHKSSFISNSNDGHTFRELQHSIEPFSKGALLASFSPNGTYLATSQEDNFRVHVYETDNFTLVNTLELSLGCITALSWSVDNNDLVIGNSNGKVLLWNIKVRLFHRTICPGTYYT